MRVEGAIEKAIELCEEAIPLLPGSSLPRRRIGQYLMPSGKSREALAAFEATVRAFPDDADAWAVLGSAQCEVKMYEEYARSFERVVALRSQVGEYWRALGEAQTMVKNETRALEAFNRAVDIDPSDKDSWRNIMLTKARHRDTSSRDAAARVIALDPNDEVSLAIYAAATKEAGDFPAAVAGYERLVARYPGKAVYWRDLAGAREGMHDKPGVIAALYQVVALDRENAEAWMILGFDTYWEDRFAEAIFAFEGREQRPAVL